MYLCNFYGVFNDSNFMFLLLHVYKTNGHIHKYTKINKLFFFSLLSNKHIWLWVNCNWLSKHHVICQTKHLLLNIHIFCFEILPRKTINIANIKKSKLLRSGYLVNFHKWTDKRKSQTLNSTFTNYTNYLHLHKKGFHYLKSICMHVWSLLRALSVLL